MILVEKYYHLIKPIYFTQFNDSLQDIELAVNSCPYPFAYSNPPKIKTFFDTYLNGKGWVSNVRIDYRTNMTINFMKENVAFVLQLGNVARVYADLIKLSYLYEKQLINTGIIAVACKNEAKLLGQNYANFDRLVNELKVYGKVILTPMVIIGLSNN